MKSHRSWIIAAVALFACALINVLPASAEFPLHRSDHVFDVYSAPTNLAMVISAEMFVEKAVPAHAVMAVDSEQFNDGTRGRTPYGLKPEYEASYASDGLSFVETRLRC